MDTLHFDRMKKALDMESSSDHPWHKVGAVLCGHDLSGEPFEAGRANYWPQILKAHIPQDEKLGNASTTVHAEIAAILSAPATEQASLYVTDLPCPNCAKMMAEARIGSLYIDSNAKHSDLGVKMKGYFEDVSSIILKASGIQVYELDCAEKSALRFIGSSAGAMPSIEYPIYNHPLSERHVNGELFWNLVTQQKAQFGSVHFAACIAKSRLGNYAFIATRAHRSIGVNDEQVERIANLQGKYTAILQPLDRLLIASRRFGLKMEADYIYSAHVPTSREFVNLIGAGYNGLHIGDETLCRDEFGLRALAQLRQIPSKARAFGVSFFDF